MNASEVIELCSLPAKRIPGQAIACTSASGGPHRKGRLDD